MSGRSSVEHRIVDLILAGDLSSLQRCCLSRTDINRPLLRQIPIIPVAKYNRHDVYAAPPGPTPVMLAILCEQDEILSFLLDRYSPDLGIRAGGLTALHLAALVCDPRPLSILLSREWVRAHIDLPVTADGHDASVARATTALHLAVLTNRLAQAAMLLSASPAANVDQVSGNGVTPLGIAVRQGLTTMATLLLAAGADRGAVDANGMRPMDIAVTRRTRDMIDLLNRSPTTFNFKHIAQGLLSPTGDDHDEDEEEDDGAITITTDKFEVLVGMVRRLSEQIARVESRASDPTV
jgi:ankyrin repeat protein